MQITTRIDYAIHAMLAIAVADPKPVTADKIADAGQMSPSYLYAILTKLKHAALLHSRRGPEGGYVLAWPASQINLREIVRAIEGGLIETGPAPHGVAPHEGIAHLPTIWVAAHTAMLDVLGAVTLADLVANQVPETVRRLAERPPHQAPLPALGQLEGANHS